MVSLSSRQRGQLSLLLGGGLDPIYVSTRSVSLSTQPLHFLFLWLPVIRAMSTRDGYEDDAWGGRSPERSVSSSESRSRSRFRRHLYPRSRAQVSSRREPVAKLTPARPPTDPVGSHETSLRQTDRPVLCFPAIDVRNELNSKLAQALFKVAHPKGPYTHEVFMILCAHNGDKSDAAKGGIWQVVRGACSHYGIAYKEYFSYWA